MSLVQKLVTQDSFDARGVLVKAGHIGVFDTELLNGEEKHIQNVGDFQPAIVEMAPISPTGPNPKIPQQVPPDAVQDGAGTYALPGKTLVAEVTDPQEQRIEQAGLRDPDAEAKVTETLADVMDANPDKQLRSEQRGGRGSTTGDANDTLVDGTVAEVTANLGTQTDDQLRAIQAAERDREKPRAGVLNAIQDELDTREKANKS